MTKIVIDSDNPQVLEMLINRLAELEHEQWRHWINFQLENNSQDNWEKWVKQAHTPYYLLTEKEAESDKEWARKAIAVLETCSEE